MSADLAEVLAAWLANMDPADLLPARRRDEAARIERPLALVGAAWIDDAHGYALVRDARAVTYGVPVVVVAHARDGGGGTRVRRATAGDGTASALVHALHRFSRNAGETVADVRFVPRVRLSVPHETSDDAAVLVGDVFMSEAVGAVEAAFDVDQTNDLVVAGGLAVVKWDLHPQPGDQAGPARLAALARADFAGTPSTWALVALSVGGEPFHVATVGAFVPDAVDGWTWAVDDVRALARGESGTADDAVREVAVLVADLHAALAVDGIDHAAAADVARWVAQAETVIDEAVLDAGTRTRVAEAVAPLAGAVGTPVVPIHGDLHVGQVLRAGEPARYLVIDFDGSPTDGPAERLAPQPVARDVASMLASWDHVGRVVLHRTDDLDAGQRQSVHDWIESSQDVFLDAYERRLAQLGLVDLLDRGLVRAYQVLQDCREYAYARRYLPRWRYVPDAALPALLTRPEGTPR